MAMSTGSARKGLGSQQAGDSSRGFCAVSATPRLSGNFTPSPFFSADAVLGSCRFYERRRQSARGLSGKGKLDSFASNSKNQVLQSTFRGGRHLSGILLPDFWPPHN